MHPELQAILDEARAQIARGAEPDTAALEARIRDVIAPEGGVALRQLDRLLAVHRARKSLAAPTPAPPPPAPLRRRGRAEYRARPTIASTMAVRARQAADGRVALEWDGLPAVKQWDVRLGSRPDPRKPYVDGEAYTVDTPRVELTLDDLPQRVSIAGRNPAGRVVQRALITGLTSANWSQRWQQRPTAT